MSAIGGHQPGPVSTFAPASSWTDPAPGDLVKITTGGNYEVTECGATDVPDGVVQSVLPDKTAVAVELFTGGAIVVLPYTGSPTRGQQIQASAATTVQGVASGGVGKIVAVDRKSGYVDVLFT